LTAARNAYQRGRELFDKGLIPSSGLSSARERLAAAERALAAARVEVQATVEERAARDAIDARRARLQSESRISQAEQELKAARQAHELVKQRFEIGTARTEDLAETQARLAAAEHLVATAIAEHDLTQEEIALRQQRMDELRRLVQKLESVNARYALERGGDVDRLLREVPAVQDPGAQAQAGDILSIEISGEPELPRGYRVDANGAIRLPLIGAITVSGLTAAQVREAVARELQQRRLGEGKTVTVTLRRPQ
jgi:chromosome segregation ATPase